MVWILLGILGDGCVGRCEIWQDTTSAPFLCIQHHLSENLSLVSKKIQNAKDVLRAPKEKGWLLRINNECSVLIPNAMHHTMARVNLSRICLQEKHSMSFCTLLQTTPKKENLQELLAATISFFNKSRKKNYNNELGRYIVNIFPATSIAQFEGRAFPGRTQSIPG
mmetsp:Transcript_7323/g.11116  ORF Transcript_7323/g.11116 Transcript_7323/m.11116 type:complete len:166 (-) Transcript_7323:259-756(-)